MTHQAQEGVLPKQQWIETHEVMAVDPSGITVRITTEEWSEPGQVRVGALYETRHFDVPLQGFDFPPASGGKWNQWVRNSDEPMKTHDTTNRHVRIDRWEKVSTPAGTFDAIKLGVVMHLDDGEFWRGATTCTYSVWYAPAVRNVVREERNADYVEKSEGDSIRTQHALLQLSDFTPGNR